MMQCEAAGLRLLLVGLKEEQVIYFSSYVLEFAGFLLPEPDNRQFVSLSVLSPSCFKIIGHDYIGR